MKNALIILLLQLPCTFSFAREKWTWVETTTIEAVFANKFIKTASHDMYVVKGSPTFARWLQMPKISILSNGRDYKMIIPDMAPVYCTQVDQLIESRLEAEYEGPGDHTIYELLSGELWQQAEHSTFSSFLYSGHPTVAVFYFENEWTMVIGTVDKTMEVKRICSGLGCNIFNSRIDGDFDGWTGETTFKLSNGQTWRQASYGHASYHAQRPEVTVYETDNNQYMMYVHGMSNAIEVSQVR